MKKKIEIKWTCSDFIHHHHSFKFTAWLGIIKFKGGIFALEKIKNRLFVFCPKVIYEIVKNKKGFKKVKVYA